MWFCIGLFLVVIKSDLCKMTQEDKENILKDFINEMFDNVQDVPPEIMEIVDEYFFEML